MPIKFKNQIALRLTDEQTDFLIELMNDNFMIDSISDAIRYCINSEIHYSKINKKTDENCIQQTSVHIANQKGEDKMNYS